MKVRLGDERVQLRTTEVGYAPRLRARGGLDRDESFGVGIVSVRRLDRCEVGLIR